MQAIATKFIAPTTHRRARVKATANAGSLTVPWNHALDVEQNHRAAAAALAQRLGWHGAWAGGSAPGACGNVYVNVDAVFGDGFRVEREVA
jgi:hypothetical protein